ncbi:glycosyltransferase family 15 protein, partial [Postia placenta MAD-698-R-SB12]
VSRLTGWGTPPPPAVLTDYLHPAPPANASVRANATLLMLARNADTESAVRSVRELEQSFNQRFNYPWVFLNDDEFSDDFKTRISNVVSGPVSFGRVPREHWVQPASIDEDRARAGREKMEKDGIIYGVSANDSARAPHARASTHGPVPRAAAARRGLRSGAHTPHVVPSAPSVLRRVCAQTDPHPARSRSARACGLRRKGTTLESCLRGRVHSADRARVVPQVNARQMRDLSVPPYRPLVADSHAADSRLPGSIARAHSSPARATTVSVHARLRPVVCLSTRRTPRSIQPNASRPEFAGAGLPAAITLRWAPRKSSAVPNAQVDGAEAAAVEACAPGRRRPHQPSRITRPCSARPAPTLRPSSLRGASSASSQRDDLTRRCDDLTKRVRRDVQTARRKRLQTAHRGGQPLHPDINAHHSPVDTDAGRDARPAGLCPTAAVVPRAPAPAVTWTVLRDRLMHTAQGSGVRRTCHGVHGTQHDMAGTGERDSGRGTVTASLDGNYASRNHDGHSPRPQARIHLSVATAVDQDSLAVAIKQSGRSETGCTRRECSASEAVAYVRTPGNRAPCALLPYAMDGGRTENMAKCPAARATTADVAKEEWVVCVTSVAAAGACGCWRVSSAARLVWVTAITGPRVQDAHYYIRDERVAQGVRPAHAGRRVQARAVAPDETRSGMTTTAGLSRSRRARRSGTTAPSRAASSLKSATQDRRQSAPGRCAPPCLSPTSPGPAARTRARICTPTLSTIPAPVPTSAIFQPNHTLTHPLAYPPATPTPELRASPPERSPRLLARRRDAFHHRMGQLGQHTAHTPAPPNAQDVTPRAPHARASTHGPVPRAAAARCGLRSGAHTPHVVPSAPSVLHQRGGSTGRKWRAFRMCKVDGPPSDLPARPGPLPGEKTFEAHYDIRVCCYRSPCPPARAMSAGDPNGWPVCAIGGVRACKLALALYDTGTQPANPHACEQDGATAISSACRITCGKRYCTRGAPESP